HERDEFGRLAASTFLHVRKGLHRLPLVDLWRIDILKWLNSHYSNFNWELNCYKNCLTIDVDSAYAYLYKGWYRTLGGFAKDFLNLKFKNSLHRLLTLLRLRSDDFDTYKIIQQLEKYKNLEVTYFFLLADFKGEDVNISHRSWGMKRLIEKLSITNKIGIHPGIYSHEEFEKLAIEVSRLEKLLRKKVKDSRQHYLKFSFPEDAHRLNKLEIETDYSCGFFDESGYKNGTTLPVRFFDLSSNTVLQLRIQSFFAMDAALIRYMQWNKSEIIQHLREERLKCEARGLPYILLWHNESFSNKFVWKGWGNVREEVYSN
ncbi:MAG: DUF7033 domain-containing protein, partial [Bacteroidota bacterium]